MTWILTNSIKIRTGLLLILGVFLQRSNCQTNPPLSGATKQSASSSSTNDWPPGYYYVKNPWYGYAGQMGRQYWVLIYVPETTPTTRPIAKPSTTPPPTQRHLPDRNRGYDPYYKDPYHNDPYYNHPYYNYNPPPRRRYPPVPPNWGMPPPAAPSAQDTEPGQYIPGQRITWQQRAIQMRCTACIMMDGHVECQQNGDCVA